jgi:hypothetical protein
MPENIAGINYANALSVLSTHCSEMSSSTDSKWEPFKMTFTCGNMKSHKEPNNVSTVDIPTLVFVFWPKITSL